METTDNLYKEKIILAPMVRMNTLPFRLLALDYGADIVFSEEIVDHKILRSKRHYNEILNTVDFIDCTDGSLIFRTCSREKDRIIFQIGTSNPERAAKAALVIEKDVAGIDINMGCPKHFSLSGGMGAALLSNSSNAGKIVNRVKKTVNVPVSCKIRILSNAEDTVSFCKMLVENGVNAISVHGRTVNERPQHCNRKSVIATINRNLHVPIIANGESSNINTYNDIMKFKLMTNCTSVMIARAAQYNVSIFRKEGILPRDEVIQSFLKYAVHYNNCFSNTKYCVQNMLRDLQDTPRGKLFLETQNLEQICKIWHLDDFYHRRMNELNMHGLFEQLILPFENDRKKLKCDVEEVERLSYIFIRSNFTKDADLPKSVLLRLSQRSRIESPKYEVCNIDKLFRSVVTYNGKQYSSSHWEKNKKSAEQAAAAVCLCNLNVFNENELRLKGIITGK